MNVDIHFSRGRESINLGVDNRMGMYINLYILLQGKQCLRTIYDYIGHIGL